MELRRTPKPALGDNASYSTSSDILSWGGEPVGGNGTKGGGGGASGGAAVGAVEKRGEGAG